MRRLALEGSSEALGTSRWTLDLYDFGINVDVKVPPPSKAFFDPSRS